ncbi:OmpH family outer membrane protein [Fluviibacter phosphoraccumulans]|jgi:outer membrane protein|uniref:Outer membrane protein chaperone n=1 Tax=Fluviibacter phosphoraccumulans TaxID=1751046 RepID=A0A679IAA0_9RHOO|nr:OmpH family outer membrane protein [Fluviibacter phosphoraccumulans]BBU69583.1 outer membrane protein chaperone [Fluviibacter phosphoraccumulans]BBU71234.1 outer membrane protein chaperone [Fluviibacter phosphoraccumulans]BCA65522.1 outer membrane protein chaperone [Fluviibacter phosphoraccumulans]
MNRLRSNRLLLAVLASAGLLVSSAGFATETKIGFVDMQRLFDQAPIAVKANKKLTVEFAKRELELQKLGKQIKSQQDTLEKSGSTMSETDRRNRERDLSDASREFQRKQREFREDLDVRRNEAMAVVIERANKALKQIAETEKYDLIIQDAVYFSPRIDITDKIIKALADDGKLPAQ